MSDKPTNVGGQAVIEGVMMRYKERLAIAVRCPNKEISLTEEKIQTLAKRWPILGLPIVRGSVSLVEAMVLGVKALTISANKALDEEEEELGSWALFLTVTSAISLAVGLFILLPTIITGSLRPYLGRAIYLNISEGLMRVVLFLSYIFLISRWEDMRRVFQYHGAEHKAIFCLEAGEPLTVANARRFTTLHPHCGTSFLLIVMIISIILFSFFGWPSLLQRLLIRLVLLPLVAGLAYEGIRLAGRSKNPVVRYIMQPGLLLQRLTTAEPDDSQLEVALRALEAVLANDTAAPIKLAENR
ncbi:MAG: DUF1385 domain-containing protein [Dethiobacteria bacterium]|jgi:uncharacterized protein YqhQ